MADLIKSIPAPLNKLVLAGGWVWVGYAAAKLIKLAIPETAAQKAAGWFDLIDNDNSGHVTKEEFVTACKAGEIAGGALAEAYKTGVFDKLIAGIEASGLQKDDFVKAWADAQAAAQAAAKASKSL
eukprot:TRINITY_DN983_c0_g1_i1.p1 TRINITY_DN983_c0_g1~~TRINITY_DN983_c0_g1_i1.p1  ORF type:complete len:126 (-),score=51.07 TRINITY_DN983_c0_g1_i1:317-694(-)